MTMGSSAPCFARRLRSTSCHLNMQSARHAVQLTGGALPSGELWDASAAPGIGLLEHVNLYVGDREGDRETAESFYFGLLGLVPDPRLPGQYRKIVADATDNAAKDTTGTAVAGSNQGISDAFAIGTDDLIHANAGRLAQMHLPVSGRRGQVGSQTMKHGQITLAYSADSLSTVANRLTSSADLGHLNGRVTLHEEAGGALSVIDPWGQHWRLVVDEDGQHAAAAAALGTHPSSLHLTPLPVGIPRVEIACPAGAATAIANFYATIFHAAASAEGGIATIRIAGGFQELCYVETDDSLLPSSYLKAWTQDSFEDQFHIAMYIEDFEGTYFRFQQHPKAILWDNPRIKDYAYTIELAREREQFRFKDIVDLETGETVMELEHEIRSFQHTGCPLGRNQKEAKERAVFLGTDTPVFL